MTGDVETIGILCEAHWKLDIPDIPKNFLQLSETQAAKFGSELEEEALRCEHAWLEYCAPLIDYKRVVLPKFHGPLITHGKLTILVMELIAGVVVEDLLKDGQELSDYNSSRICDAYLALRKIKSKTDELCPAGSWYVQGHIFKPFGDGDLVKSSRTELNAYTDND